LLVGITSIPFFGYLPVTVESQSGHSIVLAHPAF
jgi:hypothetical protein